MSVTTRFGFGLLGAATALGVLGDLLLRVAPWGVNAALWIACLIVGVVGLARWQGRPLGAGLGLLAVTLFFALLLAGRDSAVLAFLAIIAVLALLGLAPLGTGIARLASSGLADNVWRLMLAGFNACVGPLPVLLNDIRWPEVRGGARLQAAFPALRGVVLTAPLLLIFGALFASADANFAHAVGQLFNWDIDDAVLHLLFAGFWAWIVAGGLSYLFMETGEFSLSGKLRGLVSVGVTEIGIALAALDALFLAFVVVQTPYLFGGARTVEASAALSYAEYARRGFFELVIVAALVLPLLLVADWALRRERPREVTVFRVLAGVLVGLVFIIMASAVQRMMLYQDEYGLTELRVYTTAFMGWLAVLFALFAGTVLSGRPRPFAFAALSSGLVAVLLLHGLNPDALIARTNVARARFDPYYAGALSADAVPVLLQALPGLSPADAVIVASCLLQRWTPLSNADWRSANMARSIARESVQANAGQLLHIMEAANVSASEYIQCGYASRRR